MRIGDLLAGLRHLVAGVGVLEIARPAAEPRVIVDHVQARPPVLQAVAERFLRRFVVELSDGRGHSNLAQAFFQKLTPGFAELL